MAYGRRRRRPRRRRRKRNGMKVKHKQMLWGAGAITAFFLVFPTYFGALHQRIRGGQG